MPSPEIYWDFIERMRQEVQLPPYELHHIRSQKNFPELTHLQSNHLVLGQSNHDYGTLLQCKEENYPLLCPWQANRLLETYPELELEIKHWLSVKGKKQYAYVKDTNNSHYLTPEVCSEAGKISWDKKSPEEQKEHMDKMRSRIDHKSRTDALAKQDNFMGKQPWWHRFVDGKIERKRSFTVPEGSNWKSGKGDSYQRKRVRCTITGHEGTQQSLARWQKNRGIDSSNRIFIGDYK